MATSLFPVCAIFGPVFMALAHLFPCREGFQYGLLIALPGAFMVTAALIILFRKLVARDKVADHAVG